ncbi:MAG TPA: hypothetical protein VIY96_12500 [Thermoanaerobaculia bacterium]
MSSATPGPVCPRCRRPIAAWRLEHCVYCGESFPPDLKEGHSQPEALKWVERPAIPSDAARQLELMKVLPMETKKKARPALLVAGVASIAAFTIIFALLYVLMQRLAPTAGGIVLVIAAVFLGYLGMVFLRLYRRGPG